MQPALREGCTHCGEKAWSVRELSPVIVGTEKVLREASGPVSGCIPSCIPTRQSGKVVARGCARLQMGVNLLTREPEDHEHVAD